MRVYIASLSDYNAGILHGEWVEVTDPDTMQEEITAMLAESPTAKEEGVSAEEHAIHDYEGFGEIRLSEYESVDTICRIAEGIEEHGPAFIAWLDGNPSKDPEDFTDEYMGEWPSLADYVEDWWEGDMPKSANNSWWQPVNYIDWERMARDLELSGDIRIVEGTTGTVFVFSN